MPVSAEAHLQHQLELAAEVLLSGGAIRLQALGTSMLPTIWPGDVLGIEPRPQCEIVPGDIVLVARQRRFFVHRLIVKHNAGWITRGDSLPRNDEPADEGQVLGRVSVIHRKAGAVAPSLQLSLFSRAVGWVLCHWDLARGLALRIHSFRQCRIEWWQYPCSAGILPSLVRAGRTHDSRQDGGATLVQHR
jgi:peptidase S24-like protein